MWSGAYDIGTATAQLRGNGPGATAPPFTLFTTDSRVTSASAPELRVGFALSRSLAAEFGLALTRPHVGVAIASDAEATAQQLLGEELQQYIFEGGVTWQLPIGARRKLRAVSVRAARPTFVSFTKIARSPNPVRSTMPVSAHDIGCAAAAGRLAPSGCAATRE